MKHGSARMRKVPISVSSVFHPWLPRTRLGRSFALPSAEHHGARSLQARQAFDRAVRNWKAAPVLTLSREDYLRSTWQEARTLLFGSDMPAARS